MATKSLQQIHADCISATKLTKPTTIQNGNFYKWKGRVTSSITVKLRFRSLCNFGFVIRDDTASIPCIIVDPIATSPKLLKMCDETVTIRDPQFMVELVMTQSKQYDLVHLFIELDNIYLHENNTDSTMFSSQIFESSINSGSACFTFDIVLHKISPAILTNNCEVLCLILVTVIYQEQDDKQDLVWLILKNQQVTWKDFLIQSRKYKIYLANEAALNDFKRYKSFLAIADKYFSLPYRQMLHHKNLIKTNAVTILPENSQISSDFKLYREIPVENWFSILDERLYNLRFASVYGIIKDINYTESWNMMNCPWCDPLTNIPLDGPSYTKETHAQEHSHRWSTPLTELTHHYDDEIYLPQLECETYQENVTGFGIRGGKINVQIMVQDVSTQNLSYVFLKRWKMEQYPAGLINGLAVCFTDVNVKRSKKNNLYFVNTPLTRIIHLNVFDLLKEDRACEWGRFGFPYLSIPNEKIWGILDLDILAKVTITTLCKLCKEPCSQYRCPNVICTNNRRLFDESLYEVLSTARLFVRGIYGCEASSLYLKNECVQTYLDIPDKIWQMMCKLSARSKLVYSYDSNELSNGENTDRMILLLYLYCKHFRFRNRFHVCCKRFKGDTGYDRKFFCVDMIKVNHHRAAITRALNQPIQVASHTKSETSN